MAELAPQLEQWIASLGRRQNWFALLHISDLERAFAKPDPIWNEFFDVRKGLDGVPPISDSSEIFFAVPKSRWTGAMQSLGEIEATYDGAIRKFDGELERFLGLALSGGRDERTTIAVLGTDGATATATATIAQRLGNRLAADRTRQRVVIDARTRLADAVGADGIMVVTTMKKSPMRDVDRMAADIERLELPVVGVLVGD